MRRWFGSDGCLAALVTTLITGTVFLYCAAPGVTLGNSGELVTAAFTLGVPHPPGFPQWTLFGFLWSHLLLPFGNPAWRMAVFSAVTGAVLAGVIALTMAHGVRLLLAAWPWGGIEERLQRWIAVTLGISTALLYAFSVGVWYWACVPEHELFYTLLRVVSGCALLAWIGAPHRRTFLYLAIFLVNGGGIFKLGFYEYPEMDAAIVVLLGSFVLGIEQFRGARHANMDPPGTFRILMTSLAAFWELCMAGLLCFMVVLWVPNFIYDPDHHWKWTAGVLLAVLLTTACVTGWWRLRRVFGCAGVFLAGLAWYVYLPLAAATNPPMNWGHAATLRGFLHMVSVGSYEQLWRWDNLQEVPAMVKAFGGTLGELCGLPLALVSLATVALLIVGRTRVPAHTRAWFLVVWLGFLAMALAVMPKLLRPDLDSRDVMAWVAPAHAYFAMLIGLGIGVLLGFVAAWRVKGVGVVVRCVSAGLLVLPLVLLARNWPACSQRWNDFGYRFGHLMFNPGGGYAPMECDAILFAGTDAGRFVATYMVFCESRAKPRDRYRDKTFDRSDVYVVTQNALADSTYMAYIRDHYDTTRPANNSFVLRLLGRDHAYPQTPIRIPSEEDSRQTFERFVQDAKARRRLSFGSDITLEGGHFVNQGVMGVMCINGLLAQWIFERNKEHHSFYVEESYVLPWMYAYMRPHGIILRLENEPLPSPQDDPGLWADIVNHDRTYWDERLTELLSRPEFLRDPAARKTFAKLRTAIAGLYGSRGLIQEAEYAFRQAMLLCPENAEAHCRLADLFGRLNRYADARTVMEEFTRVDPGNRSCKQFLDAIKKMEVDNTRRLELEHGTQEPWPLSVSLELAGIYQRLNMTTQFVGRVQCILADTNATADTCRSLATFCSAAEQGDLLRAVLERCVTVDPKNYRALLDLAEAHLAFEQPDEAILRFQQAAVIDGEAVRSFLAYRRWDPQFEAIRKRPEFQALLTR